MQLIARPKYSQRLFTPVSTGKVSIGLTYVPRPQAMTADGLILQRALLRSKRLGHTPTPLWVIRLNNLIDAFISKATGGFEAYRYRKD